MNIDDVAKRRNPDLLSCCFDIDIDVDIDIEIDIDTLVLH